MHLTQESQPRTSGLMLWQSENSCVSVLWTTGAVWHPTDCTKCSGAWKQTRRMPQVLLRRDILWTGISHFLYSFGFTEKGSSKSSHQPIGVYGNGFKSGSMRLGRDALIFTKNGGCQSVGMLSQSFLQAIKAQAVIVPIAPFNQQTNILLFSTNTGLSTQDFNIFLLKLLLCSKAFVFGVKLTHIGLHIICIQFTTFRVNFEFWISQVLMNLWILVLDKLHVFFTSLFSVL